MHSFGIQNFFFSTYTSQFFYLFFYKHRFAKRSLENLFIPCTYRDFPFALSRIKSLLRDCCHKLQVRSYPTDKFYDICSQIMCLIDFHCTKLNNNKHQFKGASVTSIIGKELFMCKENYQEHSVCKRKSDSVKRRNLFNQ